MSTHEHDPEPVLPENEPKVSSVAADKTYWDIVTRQFKKQRTAVFGLWVILTLFLLAVCAPLLATSSPFYLNKDGDAFLDKFDGNGDGSVSKSECKDPKLLDEVDLAATGTRDGVASREDIAAWGAPSSPWLKDLFDRNIWPSGVDVFFNLLLAGLIPFGLAIFLVRRFARHELKTTLLLCLAVLVGTFVCMVGPDPVDFLRYSSTKRDYIGRVLFIRHELPRAREKMAKYKRVRTSAGKDYEQAQRDAAKDGLDAQAKEDAEAVLLATQDEFQRADRQHTEWKTKLKAIEKLQEDPVYDFTVVMPPIGFHHDDQDTERVTEKRSINGWGLSHLLGTDTLGRDVLARILYGARVSLTIGVIAVAIYCTIGAILGSLMGYFGGWVDMLLMRLVEIMMCFPRLPFILIIVAIFGKSIFLIMVAIGLVGWAGVARLIRGQFFTERSLDYVVAAKSLGLPESRIVFKHVLPNAIHPMFVTATFGVAAAILVESGLAFLGLGDPNVPSWGQMLLKGRETMSMWLILSPGIAIFITVTALNLVGEGLRDALDPKLRQ